MNRRQRFLLMGAALFFSACSDGIPTDPQFERNGDPPAFAIGGGSALASHNGTGSSYLYIKAPAVNGGDVLIAHIVARNFNGQNMLSGHAICPPAGWTSIRRTNNKGNKAVNDISQETFVYVAAENAPLTTHVWRFRWRTCAGTPLSRPASGAITRFTGVDPAQPIDVHAGNAGDELSGFATPGLTTTADSAIVVRFVGISAATPVSFTGAFALYGTSSTLGSARTIAGARSLQLAADSVDAGPFALGTTDPVTWVGQTIALRPLFSYRTLLADSYSRAIAEGWGTAERGGRWFLNQPGSIFSVDGAAGVVTIATSNVHNAISRDTASYGVNVTGITSFRIDRAPDGGFGKAHTVQVYARRNDRLGDGNNYYRFRVRMLGSNGMDARIEKTVNAVAGFVTDLVKLPMTFVPDRKYWIRWEVIGTSPATTVRMRVWPDGEPEPQVWDASATVDEPALDASGTSGYRLQVANGQLALPVRFTFDDLIYSEVLR
jgi:hypothetical protein